jgi:uncharacterized protein YhhL (DUF1145 family)
MHFGLSLTQGAVVMAAFSVGVPALIWLVTLVSLRSIPKNQRIAVSVFVTIVIFLVSGLSTYFLVGELHAQVVIGDQLDVQASPFISIAVYRADVVRAYSVKDWTDDPALAISTRTNGTSIGSYQLGQFRLTDGRAAVLMLSGPDCVVSELKDRVLMLAPDDLAGFVQALQAWGVTVK